MRCPQKQILNRNPTKEGVGFERKMNVDGSYWKPEQYPKTTWVAAKGPPVDPSNLSGFTCESPHLLMSHLTPTINCSKIRDTLETYH